MLVGIIRLWKRRRTAVVALALVGVGAGTFGLTRLGRTAPKVPTAEVKSGEFVDFVQLRGEVRALKSITLVAPSGAGEIQIVELAKNGALIKKGDLLARFDSTNMQRTLEQKRTELKQAEAEIERIRAQGQLTEEQTQTDLVKVRYDVERARLEASKSEILSQIEGEKARLSLANAEQKQREVEEKLRTDRVAAEADVAARKQKREKALYEVRQAERSLEALALHAPVDGMVSLLQNWRGGGMFGQAPEWRQGDRAWPGAGIAELPDLNTMRVSAQIEEADRGRLRPGQSVEVRVDAVPDKQFSGRVEEISTLARLDFSSWPPPKNFTLLVQLGESEARLRPGMSASARVITDKLRDSILIPAEAVFYKAGRIVVYVFRGSEFEERPITVARRNASQVQVARGVQPGERVATRDPSLFQPPAGAP